jgi:hypothetical protein
LIASVMIGLSVENFARKKLFDQRVQIVVGTGRKIGKTHGFTP